jgi:zinc transport system substrate-binding protein
MKIKNKKMIAIVMCSLLAFSILGIAFWTVIALTKANEPPEIVCTTFVTYDWVRETLGERADDYEIMYLMESGIDLHNFSPSAKDIKAIKNCKILVYIGGESDKWLDDVLDDRAAAGIKKIALLDVVAENQSALEEEEKEGMQPEEGEDAGDAAELDEHIWLSLQNAKVCVSAIAKALGGVYTDKAAAFAANADAYNAKLETLDGEYRAAVGSGTKDTLIVADRFPFRYLCRDYGLDYFAAFVGCSSQTEAGFATIKFLADKIDELHLTAIIVIETSDKKIANTVRDATAAKDQTILLLHSAQSVAKNDLKNTTYLGIMTGNLAVLRQAIA